MASHNLNQASSRSHVIYQITVESVDRNNHNDVAVSKLQLVDLAGSERSVFTGINGNSGKTSLRQKESIQINKSLFVLRKVIKSLTN